MSRRVLITGANKGIGLAAVKAVLEQADDTFVFLGARSKERGTSAVAEVVAQEPRWEGRVEFLWIDVSDDASVSRAAEAVRERCDEDRPLYGIVNNAGIGFGDMEMKTVLEVNTDGPKRVCEEFLPLLTKDDGRVVNVASASGPNFVAACSSERQRVLTNPEVTWEEIEGLMQECLRIDEEGGDFGAAGLGDGSPYGLSKACLNAYTLLLAREHPQWKINACTPGFIETDLTRPWAEARRVAPREMGMKPPEEGTKSILHLLFGEPGGSGWYFGSDAERSPLDRYRSPGDPPYTGD